MTNIIKKNQNTLLEKEKKLGLILLLPTILIVLSVVIFPLLANFWISFKTVSLGDLRPPKLIVKERIKGNLSDKNQLAEIQYRYRNSSIKYDNERITDETGKQLRARTAEGKKVFKKKEISNAIDLVYRHCGQKKTVIFADKLFGYVENR